MKENTKELSPSLRWAMDFLKTDSPDLYDEAVTILQGWGMKI